MFIHKPLVKQLVLGWLLMLISGLGLAEQQPAHVYIVHGYGASPQSHWFPWLKQQLQNDGVQVSVIDFPGAKAPKLEPWQQALRAQVGQVDAHTWFVTHSLGSIALLRYLESRTDLSTVGGVIVVSGFNDRLSNIPEIDEFIRPDLDYRRLNKLIHKRIVIAAENDPVVPHAFSQKLAQQLDAQFISLPKGGHFLENDGYLTFPALLDELKQAMRTD